MKSCLNGYSFSNSTFLDDSLTCCKDDSILPETKPTKSCSEYANQGFSCAKRDKCNDETVLISGQAKLSNQDIKSLSKEDNPHDGTCENANEICCSSIIEEKYATKCDENDGYKCIPTQVS